MWTLLAFALRIGWLDQQSLWSDEYITLLRGQLPLNDLIDQMPVEHTPLYFVLLHGWFAVAGSSDFALRFLSALWGTLSVPLLYALGRRIFGPPGALVGVFLFAINPFHIWYSQDARMYTQLTALSLAAWWALDVALGGGREPGKQGNRAAWLAYTLAGALTLYTHYYAVLTLVIAVVYAVGRILTSVSPSHRIRTFRHVILANIGIGVLFLPWLPRALRLLDFPGWREPVTATLSQFIGIYTFGATLPATLAPWLSLLAGVFYILGLSVVSSQRSGGRRQEAGGRGQTAGGRKQEAEGRRQEAGGRGRTAEMEDGPSSVVHRPSSITNHQSPITNHQSLISNHPSSIILSLAAIAVPALVIGVLLIRKPDFHPRYFIAATPIYSLILAQGILAIGRRLPVLGGVALVVFALACGLSLRLWYTDTTYAKAYYKNYMQYILAQASPDDALLLNGPSQFLARRYGSDRLDRTVNLQSTRLRDRPQSEIEQVIADTAKEHPVVWFTVELPQTPGFAKAWLDTHGYQLPTHGVGDIGVWAYAFPPPLPPPSPPASLDGPAAVSLAWAAPDTGRLGEIIPLDLQWAPTASVAADLKVSVRLVDSRDTVVWQRDRAPADGARPSDTWRVGDTIADRYAWRIPQGIAPGPYTWRVVLYDGQTLAEQRTAVLGVLTIVEGAR